MRLMGVLNLIAVSYFCAGLAFCFLRRRPTALAGVAVGLLLGYAALLLWVPYPDVRPVPGGEQIVASESGFTNTAQLNLSSTNFHRGVFLKGVTLANYVDQRFLPGRKYDGTWDPEGLITPVGGTACCLLGVLAGLLMQSKATPPSRKVAMLALAGAACVAAGFFGGQWLPVIKKIWSPTFVLVAGGYSALMLAMFYLVVDVAGWRGWCQPFVWIGMNPITIYILNSLLGGYEKVAARFVGGSIEAFLNQQVAQGLGGLIVAAVGVGLAFALAHFLYRRKIFLRL
jgi:predicted acyltransferase